MTSEGATTTSSTTTPFITCLACSGSFHCSDLRGCYRYLIHYLVYLRVSSIPFLTCFLNCSASLHSAVTSEGATTTSSATWYLWVSSRPFLTCFLNCSCSLHSAVTSEGATTTSSATWYLRVYFNTVSNLFFKSPGCPHSAVTSEGVICYLSTPAVIKFTTPAMSQVPACLSLF